MPTFIDKWLDKQIGRLGYVKAGDVPVLPGLSGGDNFKLPDWDQAEAEDQALKSSWVFSDVRIIASICSQSALSTTVEDEEGEGQEVKRHAFTRLYRRPNPVMSGSWLTSFTVAWLVLHGKAYLWVVEDGKGDIAQLWPVPADRMEPVRDPVKGIAGYAYTNNEGRRILMPPESVCYFRLFPDPDDVIGGLGFLGAARSGMLTDLSAATWNREAFANELSLRTVIALSEKLSATDYRQAKEEIINELVELRRRYLVTRSDAIKVEQMGVPAKDMEYISGRAFNRAEIDRVFGFPEGFWSDKANRANSEAAKATVAEFTCWPILQMMAGEMTAQVLIPRYGEGVAAEFEDIRPDDRELALRERQQYWQVKAVNEARKEMGDPPLTSSPLFDTVPMMLLAAAYQAAAAPAPVPMLPPAEPAPMAMEPMPAPEGEMEAEEAEPEAPGEVEESDESADMPMGTGKAVAADLKRWKSVARRRLKAGDSPAYDFESEHIPADLHGAIFTALKAATTVEEIDAAFFLKAAPLEPQRAVQDAIERKVTTVLGKRMTRALANPEDPALLEGLSDELRAAIQPSLVDAVMGQLMEDATSVGFNFDNVVLNVAAIDWAKRHAGELIAQLDKTTRAGLQQTVSTWLQTPGMTQGELRGLLTPTFGPVRANTIAVSEVTNAVRAATDIHKAMLADAGVTTEEVWHTRNNELVCKVCGPCNGKSENEPIHDAAGGWTGQTWKERFNGKSGHPGCYCWTTLQVVKKGKQ